MDGPGIGGGLGGVGEELSFFDDPSTTSMTCLFPFPTWLENFISDRYHLNSLFERGVK